jgi:hypothetical protein
MLTALEVGQELRYRGRRVFVKELHVAAVIVLGENGEEIVASYSDSGLIDPVKEVLRVLDRK